MVCSTEEGEPSEMISKRLRWRMEILRGRRYDGDGVADQDSAKSDSCSSFRELSAST